ncbi:MAG: Crp/Fnr family transcriptional regulator [Chloroflexi bacterium]|nr:Crp/Fnr family transcriptional regulator [Chloroflexota bacterium]
MQVGAVDMRDDAPSQEHLMCASWPDVGSPGCTRQAELEYFAAHRMFGALPDAVLAELGASTVKRRYPKGQVIYFPGDSPSYVFVVQSGLVALTDVDAQGNERVVTTYTRDDVFGAAAVVLGRAYTHTALALVTTNMLLVPKAVFVQTFQYHPRLAAEVVRELVDVLLRVQQAVASSTQTPVSVRVARFLMSVASEGDEPRFGNPRVDLDFSRATLAMLLGTTRQTASRVLARFARANLIALEGRTVVILRPDQLRRLGEQSAPPR